MNTCSRKHTLRMASLPLLLLLSLFIASPLLADELVNITDFEGCQAITNDNARLLCYDTVAKGGIYNEEKRREAVVEEFGADKMRKPPEEKPAPAPAQPAASTTAPRSTPARPPASSSDLLAVTVVRVKKDTKGFYYFQTADNQVWKQQNAGAWPIKAPFEATLKKGVFSSFFLTTQAGRSTRVKRLR